MKVKRPIKKADVQPDSLTKSGKHGDTANTEIVVITGPEQQKGSQPHCSFCGKSKTEAKNLISGPGPSLHICQECVIHCGDILAKLDGDPIISPLTVQMSLQYLRVIEATIAQIREDLNSKRVPTDPIERYGLKSDIENAYAAVIELLRRLPPTSMATILAIAKIQESLLWAEKSTAELVSKA